MPGTEPQDFRIKKLLEEIRQKYSLSDLRAILKAEDLGPAPGWEKLTERFLESDVDLKSRVEVLLKGLRGDLILAGTKICRCLSLPMIRGRSLQRHLHQSIQLLRVSEPRIR